MTLLEAIEARHSVRRYLNKPIPANIITVLKDEIAACNKNGNLHIQLFCNDKTVFGSFITHYGRFSGVQNYIALVGRESAHLEEKVGYYGEHLALKAQTLGLNTCWVGLTYSKRKSKAVIGDGEKLVCVLALGYGTTQGKTRKSKSAHQVSNLDGTSPAWFASGVRAALLAPTAINQQKFIISLNGNTVTAKSLGSFYSEVDLGIIKYHFEVGAGMENFQWTAT